MSIDHLNSPVRIGISENDYRNAARLLEKSAESYNLPITPKISHMWETVLIAIKYADDRLDSQTNPQEIQITINNTLGFLAGINPDYQDIDPNYQRAMSNLAQELQQASPAQRKKFLENLDLLCKVTVKLKTEKRAREYAKLTHLEGELSANLFTGLLPDEVLNHQNYSKFETKLRHITCLFNSGDSILDLGKDLLENQTQVSGPKLWVRLMLLESILGDGVYFLRHTSPGGYLELLKIVILGINSNKTNDVENTTNQTRLISE